MAEINLTQEEANILIAMEKRRANEDSSDFPMRGQSVTLPLQSTATPAGAFRPLATVLCV